LSGLAVITGLAAEARVANAPEAITIVGAGRGDRLAADIEMAIAQGARRLLSFGIAGALAPGLQPGDLVVAQGVFDGERRLACDADWVAAMLERLAPSSLRAERSNPEIEAVARLPRRDGRGHTTEVTIFGLLRSARNDGWRPIRELAFVAPDIAGVETPLASVAAKAALYAATNAAAVDMESAIVARTAARHGLPFAILRAIADPAQRPLPPAALAAMRADGGVALGAVLGALAQSPGQLPDLVRLGLDTRRALSSLVRARALLGADFASVDLGDL
jgi:adenosylhomocysteine nucleosidase